MAKNSLSSRDVCDIIQACSQSKVSVLKFGELYVRFGPQAEGSNTSTPESDFVPENTSTPVKPNSDTEISEEQHARISQDSLVADEISTREEQLAMAMVEDPALYEQMIRDGELEDVDDESSDDEQ